LISWGKKRGGGGTSFKFHKRYLAKKKGGCHKLHWRVGRGGKERTKGGKVFFEDRIWSGGKGKKSGFKTGEGFLEGNPKTTKTVLPGGGGKYSFSKGERKRRGKQRVPERGVALRGGGTARRDPFKRKGKKESGTRC